jgi:FkbM family methyltransferase
MDNLDLGIKMSSLTHRNGWYVPAVDKVALDIILREVNDVEQMLPYCKQYRTAIQAGGNVGIWPKRLSKTFKQVITAEPDPDNYAALRKNIDGIDNIAPLWMAFGDKGMTASMDHIDPENVGAHQIKEGTDFTVVTIDSMGIKDCDFLQLDIEGYEHMAIVGAAQTIHKSWPVICLELKGLGKRYGADDATTISLLQSWGYKIVERIHRDILFVKD